MAGALTANSVTTRLGHTSPVPDGETIADVALLSPVDGANNALLTAVVIVTEGAEVDEITLQWYRCSPGEDVDFGTVLGTAVGDPFVVDIADTELVAGPIVVQAIDRGAGLTSAYALNVIGADEEALDVEAIYVDAVLYD